MTVTVADLRDPVLNETRQMPLSSGGNSKREVSDELDDFPDFMGR